MSHDVLKIDLRNYGFLIRNRCMHNFEILHSDWCRSAAAATARLKIDSLYISIDLSIVAAAAGGRRNIKSRPLNPRSGGREISV